MVRARKPGKHPKLGRQDRWPSDYGVRDSERATSGDRATDEDARGARQSKGQGRAGRSKGDAGSAGEGTRAPGPERKKS